MSQKKHILRYLECGYSISGISALDKFGCYRLSSVIFNLRSQGVNIKTRMVKNKNGKKSYAEYYIENPSGNKDQFSLELQ